MHFDQGLLMRYCTIRAKQLGWQQSGQERTPASASFSGSRLYVFRTFLA
jgi:hypothetical protein